MARIPYRRWARIGLVVGIYLLLSVYFATETIVVFLKRGIPVSFSEELVMRLLQWMPWALLTFPVLRFVGRHPLDKKTWPSSLPLHLLAGLGFSLLHSAFFTLIVIPLQRLAVGNILDYYLTILMKTIHLNLMVYFILVGLWHMRAFDLKNKASELRASRMETQLTRARLDLMRERLNPHFIFNTLHMIQAHIRKNPEAAETMISRLSDLLRETLRASETLEAPLRQELDFIKLYLELQTARFQDRMRVSYRIDPSTLDIKIPHLILQPVVENAVHHAVAGRTEGGALSISARLEKERLLLEVNDSGPGFPKDKGDLFEKGIGLKNTRDRLTLLYGEEGLFLLDESKMKGARVVLGIPLSGRED